MTLDEIRKKDNLSVRAYNVCFQNNLNDLKSILSYHSYYGTFINLRNSGIKTNQELINLCRKYQNHNDIVLIVQEKQKSTEEIIHNLTREQREVINSLIVLNFAFLSSRSKNALLFHLDNSLTFNNLTQKIYLNNKFAVKNMKNVGKKTIPELEIFISIIKDFIYEISELNDEKQLISVKNKLFIQHNFPSFIIQEKILESGSIFEFIDYLIKKNAFFDEIKTQIFINSFFVYNNIQPQNYQDIAIKFNLSKERIRQLRKQCMPEFADKLKFIRYYENDLYNKYGIDGEADLIDIDDLVSEKINYLDNTDFSKEFITYILSVLLNNEYSLLGNTEDVLATKQSKIRNRYNWKRFFLIKSKIYNTFDFHAFANDIEIRLNERIEESYSLIFKSYITNFITDNKYELIFQIFPIAEYILNQELNIFLNLDDEIEFTRKTTKLVWEYSYEALEALGKPSKVKQIFEKVVELNPNYKTSESSIRSSMLRANEFVSFGRQSIYGLKKWESSMENIKGGTIRSITSEYLANNDNPIHIFEIYKHIAQYRPRTTPTNIIQNLKLDKSNEYIFFNQSFIGLKRKGNLYDIKKYENLPQRLAHTIQALDNRGFTRSEIKTLLYQNFKLNSHESDTIINYIDYSNGTKR